MKWFERHRAALWAGIMILAVPLFLLAQDGDREAVDDTIDETEMVSPISPVPFREIHLSSDGVYGIDSNGTEWDFDFSTERFVTGEPGTRGTERIFRPEDMERVQREVEQRMEDLENLEQTPVPPMPEDLEERLQNLRHFRGLQIGQVTIEEEEIVDGSVAAVGQVVVKGTVNGDVISYKRITVTSTGVINGDARAPEIVRMRGGLIAGSRIETPVPEFPEVQIFQRSSSYDALTVFTIILLSLLFTGFLAAAIVPKQVQNVRNCINMSFAKSFFIGLAVWFGLGPLIILLTLTIIGIPVAILVLPIALVLAILLGIVGFSRFMGEKLRKYMSWQGESQFRNILIGLAALYFSWILMSLFAISPSGLWSFLYTLFLVVSIIIWSVVVCTGIGSVILTRFGFRDCTKPTRGQYRVSVEVGSVKPPPPPSPPPEPSAPPPPPPTPPPLSENGTRDHDRGEDKS